MLNRLLPFCAAAFLAACNGAPILADTPSALRVEPDGPAAIRVTNEDGEPVYYRIFNPDAFALWAPCTSPADCPEIAPGQTVRIEYAEIGLYAPDSTEAELHWWRFQRVGDAYVESGKGSARIQLR